MGYNRVREEQVAEPFGTLETARAVTACARSGGKRSVVAVVILRCNRVREERCALIAPPLRETPL